MTDEQTAIVKRSFSQADFDRFAGLSGDNNPIHVDPEFSARTKFGRTVAHGMLLYSTVCGVLGTALPGCGTVQREQTLMFPNPTYVGEEVTIRVAVAQAWPVQGLMDLTTVVEKAQGETALQGRTLVQLLDGNGFRSGLSRPSDEPTSQPTDSFIKGLQIGQRAETRRAFSRQDLIEYADLARDTNPIVMDANYAQQMGLAGPLIPGALIGGLFSYLLGTELPGRGTNYLKQRLEYLAPAHPGQELKASVEIVRIRAEKQLVNLKTVCVNPSEEIVCRGEALVLVSDTQPS